MKEIGWVFRIKGTKGTYSSGCGCSVKTIAKTQILKQAIVFNSRSLARACKLKGETIEKARLNKFGQPVQITGRG